MTQSATQLVAADVADDVALTCGHDVMMTSSMTRLRPDPIDPDIDPTRSTTRPDQRSTTRPDPVNADPVNLNPAACTRAATRCHTRRAFWWRVRARVMVFLGKLDIYRFVSKFSTMWYIDFTCLKLLQI